MATRVDESLPTLSPPTQSTNDNTIDLPMLGQTARLFAFAGEEPLLDGAHGAAGVTLPSRDVATLVLQRCLDLTIATLCLLVLWPIMLIAACAVAIGSPGPVFYIQPRLGRDGEIFGCLKFRTMRVDADRLLRDLLESSAAIQEIWKREQKLRDDPRITPFGHILRRYSIDELPQLLNVLRGEMSIVGPRPIVEAEIERYAARFSDYCRVKPGLTGLWQISGRNSVSYQRRVELDSHYVRTKSLRGDLWILVRTVPVVLRGTGV